MCDVDRRCTFFADHLLEGLQNLYLGRDIKCRRGLVQDQEVWLAAQRHRGHQSLQLAARDLVRIAIPDPVGVRQLKSAEELQRPSAGFVARGLTIKNRRFDHLLHDLQGRVEVSRSALGQIGNLSAAHLAQFVG